MTKKWTLKYLREVRKIYIDYSLSDVIARVGFHGLGEHSYHIVSPPSHQECPFPHTLTQTCLCLWLQGFKRTKIMWLSCHCYIWGRIRHSIIVTIALRWVSNDFCVLPCDIFQNDHQENGHDHQESVMNDMWFLMSFIKGFTLFSLCSFMEHLLCCRSHQSCGVDAGV